jgi:geranylgeranylglycerol-phosphate geranylgeranyltransferase
MFKEIETTKHFVEILRPYNATTAVMAFLIGYFFFGTNEIGFNFYLGISAIILIHSFATLKNDIEDIEIDKINSPEKALVSGNLPMGKAGVLAQALFLLSLVVAGLGFPTITGYVLLMLFVSWLYNSSQFRFSRRPIASIMIMATMYSAIPMSLGRILNGNIDKNFILFLIIWFLLRVSISITKDFKDAKGDKLFGKETFYLRFGRSKTIWISIILSIISLGYILYEVRSTLWIATFLSILSVRTAFLRISMLKISESEMAIMFRKIFFEQNYFDIILLIWLIL